VKSTGDGLMVAFASAVAAIGCAADMQRAASEVEGGPAMRAEISAGRAAGRGDGGWRLAARLGRRATAHDG